MMGMGVTVVVLAKDYDRARQLLNTLSPASGQPCCPYCGSTDIGTSLGRRRGLKAFPHSGALHMELGALAFKDKRYDEALMYFERGIELDPSYPDNYWRAAGIYLSSPESVWGMIYGEIYMNMVCNGEQNMEVSRLLAEAYDSNIWHEKNDRGQGK